jgi:imidazolonepropionase-like amidohydrolase
MHRHTRTLLLHAAALATAALAIAPAGLKSQVPARAPRYAIKDARIVTNAGAPIEKGTIVMRNGVIEDVGPSVTVPPDAMVIDGAGLTVYPGLIDMSNTSVVETPAAAAPAAAAQAAGAGRGAPAAVGRGGGVGATDETWADQERAKRENILNPDFQAASCVRYEGDELRRLASAGITNVLAVPPQGLIRGQSALVNVMGPPEAVEISGVGGYLRGFVVVRSPIAQHVSMAGRGGGGGYPGSLLGTIAFVRQSFYDAQWQRDARAYAARHADMPLPNFEPVLDALAPALDGRMPVAFEAGTESEILRALGLAREFKLDPIIVGGLEASEVIDDLKAAKARVILAVNFQGAGGGGGRGAGGAGGGGGDRATRMRQNAPKVAAALDKAGIGFAFTAEGLQNVGDFVRNVGRAVREGGLSEDAALKALTANAAKMAGVSDRLGTLEKGKIANVIVSENGLFDEKMRMRNVFVSGWPIDLETVIAPAQTGRGRGGTK